MIKVCHMTSAHAPGDVRIFHKECVSLGKAGYQVYLVQRGESYEASGVHVIGVGQPSGGRLTRMTAFSKKVYETARALDADIYHFHAIVPNTSIKILFTISMTQSCFPMGISSRSLGRS